MQLIRHTAILFIAFTLSAGAFGADVAAIDLSSGKMDDAIRTLNAQISADSGNAEAYAQLSRAYYSLENYDAAAKAGDKAVQLKPDNATYHLLLGKAYGGKADNAGPLSAYSLARKAVAEFERAVQLDPADKRARVALAEFYAEAPGIVGGGRDKARRLADQIANTDPATAAWIRGLVAHKDKNFAEAESQFKSAVKASGGSAAAWVELAHFYAWNKRWSEFETAINTALASNKKTPSDLFNAADLLIGTGRNFPAAYQALRTYLTSAKKDEDNPAFKAHFLLGQMYEKQGDKQQAANEYRSSLALAQSFRPAQDALKRLGA